MRPLSWSGLAMMWGKRFSFLAAFQNWWSHLLVQIGHVMFFQAVIEKLNTTAYRNKLEHMDSLNV